MNSIALSFSILMYISVIFTVTMAIYAAKRISFPGARFFIGLCISVAVYSFGYALELLSFTKEIAMFWNAVEYIGIPFIVVFSFCLAAEYTGMGKLVNSKPVKIILFSLPVVFIAFRYTDNIHNLYYTTVEFVNNGFFNVLMFGKGPLYYALIIFISAASLFSNILYLKALFSSLKGTRPQLVIMLIASVLPWIASYFNMTSSTLYGLDYSVILLFFSSLLFMFGLFWFRMLNTMPIAKDKIFHYIKEGIIILNNEKKIIDYNETASEIFPKLKDIKIGNPLEEIYADCPDLESFIGSAFNQEVFSESRELTIIADEESHYYRANLIKLANRGKLADAGSLLILSNITKLIEIQQQLETLAITDSLTGIFNRRYFFEKFTSEYNRAKRYKRPISLIILDIDLFKNVNDLYGHQAGDAVLKRISELCRNGVRSVDILARYGGEEFLILLPETHVDNAVYLAERLCREIAAMAVFFEGNCIKVTASFGVTGMKHPTKEHTVDSLVSMADKALYIAKSQGRNRVATILPDQVE